MTANASAPHIGLVVEGAGDRNAVPVLLRQYLTNKGEYRDLLGKPVPLHGRDKGIVEGGLEGYVATASFRPGCRGVLVILDSEGDCIRDLGTRLHTRANAITPVPVVIALADQDFESWLYASAETLEIGLSYTPGRSGQAEIKKALFPAKYTKPVWQPRLAARMDLAVAQDRCRSLARMLSRFDQLLGEVLSA